MTSNLKSFFFLGTLKSQPPSILGEKFEIKEGKIISEQREILSRDVSDFFSRAVAVPSGKGPADPRRLYLVIAIFCSSILFLFRGEKKIQFWQKVWSAMKVVPWVFLNKEEDVGLWDGAESSARNKGRREVFQQVLHTTHTQTHHTHTHSQYTHITHKTRERHRREDIPREAGTQHDLLDHTRGLW